jgi:hypothetical protein
MLPQQARTFYENVSTARPNDKYVVFDAAEFCLRGCSERKWEATCIRKAMYILKRFLTG